MRDMADCGIGKAPGLDDQSYDLYKSMPDLFGYIVDNVYTN